MKCNDVRAALPLLIYGEPCPEDAALREHLAQCAACRREQETLQGVRRLLDDGPVPRVAVDLPRLHQSLAERQMRRERRWRRIAWTFGAVAALLLLAIGLHLEVRVEASQLIVRWGEQSPPVGQAFQPDPRPTESQAGKPDLRDELRVFSELIHALKRDADDRDQRLTEQIERLQKHVRALQSQADLRWNSTEEYVAALYRLTRKGEKP